MDIKEIINTNYERALPFEGIINLQEKLSINGFLVIEDEKDVFYGILTPIDIIQRPHKIAIDCLEKKSINEYVQIDESLDIILEKMDVTNCSALPVLNGDKIIGIIEKQHIINKLTIDIKRLQDQSLISKQLKDQFLKNLSHEIRTPLNGISTLITIISNLQGDTQRLKSNRKQKVIKCSINRFLLVMNDLIELANLHSEKNISIDKQSFDINQILNELNEYFDSLIVLKNLNTHIVIEKDDDINLLYSDKNKIKHIIYHLIDNAVKNANNSSVIFRIKGSSDLKSVIFETENNFDTNKLSFHELLSVDIFDSNSKFANGLGIGLPLIRKLTNILDGQLSIENKNDKRICFKINIPLEVKINASS